MRVYCVSSSGLETSVYTTSRREARDIIDQHDLTDYTIDRCTISPNLKGARLWATLLNGWGWASDQKTIEEKG